MEAKKGIGEEEKVVIPEGIRELAILMTKLVIEGLITKYGNGDDKIRELLPFDEILEFITIHMAELTNFLIEGVNNINVNLKPINYNEDLLTNLIEKVKKNWLKLYGEALSFIPKEKVVTPIKRVYMNNDINLHCAGRCLKELMTVHGTLEYERVILVPPYSEHLDLYSASQRKTVCPLDNYLGVNDLPNKMTLKTMSLCAYVAQESNSYKHAENTLLFHRNLTIDADTIRRVCMSLGKIQFDKLIEEAEEIDQKRKIGKLEHGKVVNDRVYILADGSYLWARFRSEDKKFTFAYKETKLAVLFKESDIIRRISKNGKPVEEITNAYIVPYAGDAEQFFKLLYAALYKHGYCDFKEKIILADGAEMFNTFRNNYLPDSLRILDKFHLIERIYDYAKELYPNDKMRRERFVEIVKNDIYDRRISQALQHIALCTPPNFKPKESVNLFNYITNNRDFIDYKTYEKQGLFVGSGYIESLNKSFVHRRMREPGMRWYMDSANYMLTLRRMAFNNEWTDFEATIRDYYAWDKKLSLSREETA